MVLRKVFSGRIDSLPSGAEAIIQLPGVSGGRLCKGALYQLRMVASDGSDNIRLAVDLHHSPDGGQPAFHSTCIASANPGQLPGALLSGNCNVDLMVGEYLHPAMKIKHSSGGAGSAVWAMVELWEMRKPF